MKNYYFFILFFLFSNHIISQEIYFPPTECDEWETIDPFELNWCDEKIENLYSFLDERNSKAFIILKDLFRKKSELF